MLFHNISNTRFNTFLKIFFAYITLCGLTMFPCFIIEESIQMATFGTWPAQDAKDWNLALKGCDTIRGINRTLKILNYSVGWIQPLGFFSYRAYSHATDYYIRGLERKIFAHSPESFEGRRVKFTFIPNKMVEEDGIVKLRNGQVQIITDRFPETRKISVTGIVRVENNLVTIKQEEENGRSK